MQQHRQSHNQQHIEIAAGSIQGHTHRRKGQNNQDAFAWVYLDQSTFEPSEKEGDAEPSSSRKAAGQSGAIAIVCDGCGSCAASEVGAQLGAQWVLNAVAKRLQAQGDITDNQFWRGVKQDVLGQMRSLTTSLQRSTSTSTSTSTSNATADWEIIQSYLLFTIMGAVITPDTTIVFGVGDGVFAINDDVTSIGPFANNAPPYLAYGLMPEGFTQFRADALQFTLHCQLPTAEVRSLLIGSDGVEDLRAIAQHSLGLIADHPLPNKPKTIGDLSQFWQDDRYCKNPDMIRRRLALINREQTKPDWLNQQLTKTGGLLPDDTTLVVMRRSEPTL